MKIKLIWQIGFATSLLMLVGFVGYDGWSYVYHFDGATSDLGRRALFRIVTATDFPIVQLAVATGLNWFLCSFVFVHAPSPASRRASEFIHNQA